jgi:hypothetical protein
LKNDAIRPVRSRVKATGVDMYAFYPNVARTVRRLRTADRRRLIAAVQELTSTGARALSDADASALAKLLIASFPDSRDVLVQLLIDRKPRPSSTLQASILAYLDHLGDRPAGRSFLRALTPRLGEIMSSTKDQDVAERIADRLASPLDRANFLRLSRIARNADSATGRQGALYGLTRSFAVMSSPFAT